MRRLKTVQIFDENQQPLRLFTPKSSAGPVRVLASQYWQKFPDEIGLPRYLATRWKTGPEVTLGHLMQLDPAKPKETTHDLKITIYNFENWTIKKI